MSNADGLSFCRSCLPSSKSKVDTMAEERILSACDRSSKHSLYNKLTSERYTVTHYRIFDHCDFDFKGKLHTVRNFS